MWGWAMGGGAWLLLLLPGAVGLECLSCGAEDGSCRGATNVTCPPESDVCTEALVALAWSHGRLALGARGCGRGGAGANARALELLGLVLFSQRHQCRGGGCNWELPLGQQGALPLPGNASAQAPNGLLCYGCPDDGPCPPAAVVQCYGDLRGCFHGNVTLTLGGVTLWREVRGCVRAEECGGAWRGDGVAGLGGSCCAGALCNGPPADRAFFAPDLPRLELLPHGHAPTPTPNPDKMAAGNGSRQEVNGSRHGGNGAANMAATRANMAASQANMAASQTNMAASQANMAARQTNMAASTTAAAVIGDITSATALANVNVANMAAGPARVTDDITAAATKEAKMAAGGAGRPLGRKDGIKGPVGRGHPMAGAGWLLPLLLLPLL